MKKTLDQIRAAVALDFKGRVGDGAEGGDKIKGFPTMIQTNGLLGALAYACERKKDGSLKNKAEHNMGKAIVCHLKKVREQDPSIITESIGDDPEDLARHLVADKTTPGQFRRINAEVLAFLNYLRRFAS